MDDVRHYLVKEFALRAALEHSGYNLAEIWSKHQTLTNQLDSQNSENIKQSYPPKQGISVKG